jgi:uncharacterized phage protein gp47/JayE
MFEDKTYEVILQEMQDDVPNDLDKREGSLIFYGQAPAAARFQETYIDLDWLYNEMFADTASRDSLIRISAGRGITPTEATYAIFRGIFNIDIPIGTRFSAVNNLSYVATKAISTGVFEITCETAGTEGNGYLGVIIPIDYIDGLQTATLAELLIPGEDEEETEHLRQRYFDSYSLQAFGGNIADYKQKVNAIDGTGGVKVYRAKYGAGTVGLVIINSQFKKPSQLLIDNVQAIIDPSGFQGEGKGLAPIDHKVTVSGVTENTVDITTVLTLQNGYVFADVKANVESVIDSYFSELAKDWESETNLIVRISQIETRLLNVSGIIDIANTTLNTIAQNLILGVDEIPIRGVVSA